MHLESARTSVSSSHTFVPLLSTEGFRILLPKSFQRERTCLMKLGIFILLLVNRRPRRGFVCQGWREIDNPVRWRNSNSHWSMHFRRHSHEGTPCKNSNHGSFGFDGFKRSEGSEDFRHHKHRRRLFGSLP